MMTISELSGGAQTALAASTYPQAGRGGEYIAAALVAKPHTAPGKPRGRPLSTQLQVEFVNMPPDQEAAYWAGVRVLVDLIKPRVEFG